MIETALLIGLVVIALAIVALVLLQQGKGADMGASFGSGASQTLFGSQGTGNFLTKSTWTLAFVFFGLCLGLAMIARDKAENAGKIDFEGGAVVEEAVLSESEIPAADEAVEETDVPMVDDSPVSEGDVPAVDVPPADDPAVEEAASDIPQ